jgi:hypothetical protein
MPRHYRYLLQGVSILIFAYIAVLVGLSFQGLHRPLIFWEKTHLTWGETRIESIEAELMRRSPALRNNFQRFGTCIRSSACKDRVDSILHERDVLVARVWPDVFSRLSIDNDWGEGQLTVPIHEAFLRYQRAYGSRMPRECLPTLEYWQNSDGQITYQLRYQEPFTCPPPPR